MHSNLQCWIRNLQNICKNVLRTQKQQQNISVGLKSMRSIFNGDVKVFETHGDSQKDTKSVREGAQRVSESLDCVCGR